MVIIIMGVSGAGKTTVGRLLAAALDWPFYEGDNFHPCSNFRKMAEGTPLTDEDRWPWLDKIRDLAWSLKSSGKDAVISCSALKQSYRYHLAGNRPSGVTFIYLKGTYALIWPRVIGREKHFMKEGLLASQFSTLEEPEDAMTIDASLEPPKIVDTIIKSLFPSFEGTNGPGA